MDKLNDEGKVKKFLEFLENVNSPENLLENIFLFEGGLKSEKAGILRSEDKFERVRELLGQASSLPASNKGKTHLGRAGINHKLYEEVFGELQIKEVTKFIKGFFNVSPQTFLLISTIVNSCLNECSREKGVNINDLKIEDLREDSSLFEKVIESMPKSKVTINYMRKFSRAIMPFTRLSIKKSNVPMEPFDHPVVSRLSNEQRRKGAEEISIHNNMVQQVKRFFIWLRDVYVLFHDYSLSEIPVWMIEKSHLEDYRLYLLRQAKEGRFSLNGTRQHLIYIKQFFSQSFQLGVLTTNPAQHVRGIKASNYKYREIPSKKDLRSFLDVVESYSDDPSKEKLPFMLMLGLGFRASEVAKLQWEGINMARKTISFERKRGKYQVLPMTDAIYEIFSQIDSFAKGAIFHENPDYFKRKLYASYKIYARIAGWKYEGGVHIFRHTFITNLAIQTRQSPMIVQELAGHDSLMSTSNYIHITNSALAKSIGKLNYTEERTSNERK